MSGDALSNSFHSVYCNATLSIEQSSRGGFLVNMIEWPP
ncbi:uncharacterized protein MP3633_0036 [Marinomonas primoryensis]|jgi:hypothetical protein|uniref:Uncharacterized protein n=1 Tax=Marinomonas primoryensis TaxID=178399 RepID=A0A859CRN7_9GAMM|nr:uncharacterized protein MP3633_0036 [Marinomonas primoryensis]